jgi:hypothetical protein
VPRPIVPRIRPVTRTQEHCGGGPAIPVGTRELTGRGHPNRPRRSRRTEHRHCLGQRRPLTHSSAPSWGIRESDPKSVEKAVATAVEEGACQNIPSSVPLPRLGQVSPVATRREAPRIVFLFRQAQVDAVQAPCWGNLRATWRVLAPRQPRFIAPLANRQGRDALGVPAVRRKFAIDLPRLEGNPAVQIFARNRTGSSKGIHRAVGVVSDGGVFDCPTGRVVQA